MLVTMILRPLGVPIVCAAALTEAVKGIAQAAQEFGQSDEIPALTLERAVPV
jgi:hypothetical protein